MLHQLANLTLTTQQNFDAVIFAINPTSQSQYHGRLSSKAAITIRVTSHTVKGPNIAYNTQNEILLQD